ncbi:MAG: hypothetical protein V1676_01900 [Candidatus Diapherotrites archaeon]
MAPKYEFHRYGKKPFLATLGGHEGHLGEGAHGSAKKIKVVFGKRALNMAEKIIQESTYKPRNVFILNKLKELKLSVIPIAWLAVEKSAQHKTVSDSRQIMTDLSRGGSLKVIEHNLESYQENPEIKRLSNYQEIEEKIGRETEIAKKHGITFTGREWLVVVKEDIGKPYIVDVKLTEMNGKVEGEFAKWLLNLGIRLF